MTAYRVLPAPARRRSFSLTFGLRVGYESSKVHSIGALREALLLWMEDRAAAGRPYLTGLLLAGEVLYAWPMGAGAAGSRAEPVAEFRGEISPLYQSSLSDEDAKKLLCEMAAAIGQVLDQERVYASFLDETWVVERLQPPAGTGPGT